MLTAEPEETQEEHIDIILEKRFGHRRKSWSLPFLVLNKSLRTVLAMSRESIPRLRLIADTPTPTPFSISHTRHLIPSHTIYLQDASLPLDGTIKAEWIHPRIESASADQSSPVMLYIHGGAFVVSTRKTHRTISGSICKAVGFNLLVPDYRRAPEFTFPNALQDCIAAYLYLSSTYKKIFVAGDSSGGGLVFSLVLWLRDRTDLPMPKGLIGISPWLDLTLSHPSFILNRPFDYLTGFVGDESSSLVTGIASRTHHYCLTDDLLHNPLVSPIYAESRPADAAVMPPTLIQIGSNELLRDESIAYYTRVFPSSRINLEIYDQMTHVFVLFSVAESLGQVSVDRIADFVKNIESDVRESRSCVEISKSSSGGISAVVLDNPHSIIEEGKKELMAIRKECKDSADRMFGRMPTVPRHKKKTYHVEKPIGSKTL